jgi:O-antigen ligase
MIIFLSLMIWFLGSRAGYLAFIALFLALSIFFMFKTRKFLVSFGAITIGFILIIVFMSPKLKKNFQEVVNQVKNQQELTSDSDIRLWLWKSGIEVFKKNYFWGVGTGDIKIVMNKKYHQYNLSLAEEKSYNLHNQYLESAVSLGFIGLLILITWMVLLFIYAINTKDFLLFFLTLIISIHFMFESMLNSIAGVSFFMFFYVLLLAKNYTHGKEFN